MKAAREDKDLGVWKNVDADDPVPVRAGVELNTELIDKIEEGTLVYPLERRTNSNGIVRFCISQDSKLGWVSEKWLTKEEEETEEMTTAKVKAVKEGNEMLEKERHERVKEEREKGAKLLEKEAKRPLQYDYLLEQIKNEKK